MADKTILIIGDSFTFPDGNAATNRVYTYARGFIENGSVADVICFRNDYLETSSGKADGINYYYPFNQSYRNSSFVIRRYHNLLKYKNTVTLVRRIRKEREIYALIAYTIRLSTFSFAWFLSKACRAKLLLERSEHPLKEYNNKITKHIGKLKVLIENRFSDGILVISEYLRKFYKNAGSSDSKLLVVPSTVDYKRFRIKTDSPLNFPYICYCGSLTLSKDGVHILIDSFARIADKYPEMSLVLIGKADTSEDEKYFRNKVSELGMEKRVVFTGLLSRNLVPAYLRHAVILTLARPTSMVAEAGFPSKLTEYLSTGKPVVVTRVGEIDRYLTDNLNVFLAEPDSIDDFVNKLEFVLSNYDIALAVGNKGRELATTIFSYNYQAKRILSFVEGL